MPKGKSTHAKLVDARRRGVAMLLLRGMTEREIEENLPELKEPILNPHTGKPYSQPQIHRDIAFLTAQWKERAAEDIDTKKALHLAELKEVRRRGWQTSQLNVVMRSLEHEARVLGLLDGGASEDLSQKMRAYLDIYDAATRDAADLSEP
jgi:hypothetical protein